MKDNRETNVVKLIEWAAFSGLENPRKWLKDQMNCSISTVNQMFRGVTPGPVLRIRAAAATKIELDQLFPVVENKKQSA